MRQRLGVCVELLGDTDGIGGLVSGVCVWTLLLLTLSMLVVVFGVATHMCCGWCV